MKIRARGNCAGSLPEQFNDAITAASNTGNADAVRDLLDGKGGRVDINAEGGYFGNVLQAAIAGGSLRLVREVVEAGAKLDVPGRYEYPVRAAAVFGRVEIVEYLLRRGADPYHPDDDLDALQAASSKGHIDVMALLLSGKGHCEPPAKKSMLGYRWNISTRAGNALHFAAFGGHEQAVQLLLEDGSDINGAGIRFRDPLQAAVLLATKE
ncbi:ankyrin [Thozetella sp. PMI_491]|nr:ankyrin [Thozetella sp. PMI_491]